MLIFNKLFIYIKLKVSMKPHLLNLIIYSEKNWIKSFGIFNLVTAFF